jgi:hypothetical protein
MKGSEVLSQIKEKNQDGRYAFISWWRREEDWLDHDLLDSFIENTRPDEEMDGFTLLTLDEMWEKLRHHAAGRVRRLQGEGGDRIVWEGKGEQCEYPFTAASVMEIFDVETEGNVFP